MSVHVLLIIYFLLLLLFLRRPTSVIRGFKPDALYIVLVPEVSPRGNCFRWIMNHKKISHGVEGLSSCAKLV